MHFTQTTSIINIALMAVHAFMMLTAAVLIYIKHTNPQNRSKSFIFAFFLTSAIVAAGEVIIIMQNESFVGHYQLLPAPSLTMSGITFFLLLFYLVEAIRPYWLTVKRLLILIAPWAILVAALAILYFNDQYTTHIYSFRKVKEFAHHPDVIIRGAMATILTLYSLWLMGICCLTKRYNPQRPMLRVVLIILLLMTVSYFFSRGMQFFWAYVVHEVLYTAITALILFVEHYERLHIPYEAVRTYYKPAVETAPSHTQETINQISISLCNIMEDSNVWSDPEITRDKIVQMVGTNRTYIQEAAKVLGFESVTDMLHRRRIEYVCERLRKEPGANMQEVFYDAGYMSRTTAWRHFTNIVGSTPTEFVEKNTPPRQKVDK
jgi:AraC-like DNA-binding protein